MSLFPTPSLACRDDHVRREQTRRAPLTGFDEVEVDEAQTTLRVTFLGRNGRAEAAAAELAEALPEWVTEEA